MKFLSEMMTTLGVPILPDLLTSFGEMNITQLADLTKLLDMKFLAEAMQKLNVPMLPDILLAFG